YWSGVSGSELAHDRSHYFTLAWFDRWLKGDLSALDRITSPTVAGVPAESLLSARYRSALAADGRECSDLRAGCSSTSGVGPGEVPTLGLTLHPLPMRGGSLTIRFTLSRSGPVEVGVYDVRGARIRTLFSGVRSAGAQELPWDGRGSASPAPAGCYFVRVRAGVQECRPIVLLR
ncbi:MAG: hypothetical protein HZA61_15465, partial [Candidatus Eisenbacteria bacterium]|nr:hypothetical protein [Candidatus Eisenbacteria bacterium]